MSLAHPRDDPRDSYPDLRPHDSSNHLQILEAISDLKNDKEALKSALQSALMKRDELLERLESYEETTHLHLEKRRQLEMENAQLKRDNGELVRKAEGYRREVQKLANSREEEQREVRDLIEKTRGLEEVQARRLRMDKNDSAWDGDLQKYAQFMLEKMETQPELLSLFRGRVSTLRQFWASLQDGRYAECLLKSFQFISDLLVFWTHNEHKRVPSESPAKSVSCQTLCDQGTNTHSPERLQERTPRFPVNLEASQKPSIDISHRIMSPRSVYSNPAVSPRAYRAEDGYAKLMDESEHLLSSLHYQSDRLVKLNSQLQQTIQNSPRQSPQYRDVTPSQLFRDESTASLRKPYIGIPLSPQSLQPVQETLKTEELSSDKELVESIPEAVPKLSPELQEPKRSRRTAAPSSKPRSVRKSPPNSRVLQFKTDVSARQEPVLPPLRNLQTWGSVSDFFSGSNRETDKTEDKEEQERPFTDRTGS